MPVRIKKLIEQIDHLNQELRTEYQAAARKYGFHLKDRRVVFSTASRRKNKQRKVGVWRYLRSVNARYIISMPFIYGMIVPIVILDIGLSLYHAVAFPLYGIPKVPRRDYIVFDRQYLDYLNMFQKFNCLYCTYANGLFAYAVEIAARTERYWCPIKAARKPLVHHGWYKQFADYGNADEWEEKFNQFEER